MANQNPQPEIYTTTHSFLTGATAGTQDIQTVYTNQNSSEEVRIYALSVNIYNTATGASLANADDDFTAKIKIGNSYVPSQSFDVSAARKSIHRGITFPTPILILFQQPISIEVTWKGGNDAVTPSTDVTVKISLQAELALAQVSCQSCGMEHPHSSGCPIRGSA